MWKLLFFFLLLFLSEFFLLLLNILLVDFVVYNMYPDANSNVCIKIFGLIYTASYKIKILYLPNQQKKNSLSGKNVYTFWYI